MQYLTYRSFRYVQTNFEQKNLLWIDEQIQSNDIRKNDMNQCKNIRSFYENYHGFSSGTRVTYHFVYKNECDTGMVDIIQYFILSSLGICVRISDFTTNYFYGGLFSHCSSVPLFVKNNKVYIRQEYVNIVATGVAGMADMEKSYMVPLRRSYMNDLSLNELKDECQKRGIENEGDWCQLCDKLLSFSSNMKKRKYR